MAVNCHLTAEGDQRLLVATGYCRSRPTRDVQVFSANDRKAAGAAITAAGDGLNMNDRFTATNLNYNLAQVGQELTLGQLGMQRLLMNR